MERRPCVRSHLVDRRGALGHALAPDRRLFPIEFREYVGSATKVSAIELDAAVPYKTANWLGSALASGSGGCSRLPSRSATSD